MPKFRCEHCRQKIAAPDDYVGRRVRCPRCKQPVRVPEVVEAAAVAATTAVAVPTTSVAAPVAVATPSPEPQPVEPTPAPATPSASPFAREHRESVFAERAQADHSALFGDSPDASNPHDLAPEEQTQVFWHMHQVAEYHEPLAAPAPRAGDFFSQPVDEAATEPAHPSELRPEPAPVIAPESTPAPEPLVVEPAEVIDVPVRRQRPGINSASEVADLLRRLDKPTHRARLAAEWVADAQQRMAPRGSRWIGVLGWASLLVGLGAIGVSFVPAQARFATPAGSTGLLLALTGLVLALGKRANVWVPICGTIVSASGVVVAILVARGILPPTAAARLIHPGSTPPVTLVADTHPASADEQSGAAAHVDYIPATSPLIAGNVEVRVASALVLRPAVYTGDYSSLHTADERRLQITLELKKVGIGKVSYEPWRKREDGDPEARATDGAGMVLPMDERPFVAGQIPVTLPVGALRGLTPLGMLPTSDVLLFNLPSDPSGDVLLDLPGRNIGADETTLHIRIPAMMVRVQS